MTADEGGGSEDFEEKPLPPDLTDNLLKRVKADVEAVYTPEAVTLMAELRAGNFGAYLKFCQRLKKANSLFSKGALDKLVDREAASSIEVAPDIDAAQMLLRLAENAELFINEARDPFIDLPVEGVLHTFHVRENDCAEWLIGQYYDATKRAPPREALSAAIDTLAAKAKRGPKVPVFARVGDADGKIFVDRGTEDRSLIEIDASGRRIVSESPIRFIRPTSGLGELPVPQPGGNIDDLKAFLNLRSDGEFVLAVAWVLGCYMPRGAFPIGWLMGPHGGGKTSAMRRLLDLVDPLADEPRSASANEQDMVVAAQRTWVQALDNATHFSDDQAATLCRMSTGGSLRVRRLYTNGETFTMHAKRPVCLTTNRTLAVSADLTDRALLLSMKVGFGAERKSEKKVLAEFAVVWPKLLGVICDAVSAGLRGQEDPEPEDLPRMADFATWVSRCETGMGWEPGTFMNAYRKNIRDFARNAAEIDILASAVMGFMDTRAVWEGKASVLLAELQAMAGERDKFRKEWPQSPNWLSHKLMELRPLLLHNSIDIAVKRVGKARKIAMVRVEGAAAPADDEEVEEATAEVQAPQPTEKTTQKPKRPGQRRIKL